MKKLTTVMIVMMVVFSATVAFAKQGMFGPDDEMRQLHEDIAANLLLQTLNLTPDQKSKIKGLIDTVRPDMQAAKQKADTFRDEQMKPFLEAVLSDLKDGKGISQPPEEIQKSMSDFRMKNMDLMLRGGEVMEEIVALLSDDQKQALQNFRPLKSMGLQGMRGKGLKGFGGPENMLEHVRTMSDEEFARLVAHMDKRAERRGQRAGKNRRGEDRTMRHQQVIALMKQVRAMDDTEYQSRLEELTAQAEELAPQHRRGGKGNGKGFGKGNGQGYGKGNGQGYGKGNGQGYGKGNGQGYGKGNGQGYGKGNGQGYGKGGPGRGFGNGGTGFGGFHKAGRLVFSDAFYNAL